MISADELVRLLNGRWVGNQATARCPVPAHGRKRGDLNPSLSIAEGDGGKTLLYCFAGCRAEEILAAVAAPAGAGRVASTLARIRPGREASREAAARKLWSEGVPVAGTPAAVYLARRDVPTESPALRFHSGLWHPAARRVFPALLASLTDNRDRVAAVQRLFLDEMGHKAMASPQRMTLGRLGRGVVRLAEASELVGLAEGVETALAASALFDIPTWAACGARLSQIDLPRSISAVVLFADHDQAGMKAALHAARTFEATGRKVRVVRPRKPGADWSDVLCGGGS